MMLYFFIHAITAYGPIHFAVRASGWGEPLAQAVYEVCKQREIIISSVWATDPINRYQYNDLSPALRIFSC